MAQLTGRHACFRCAPHEHQGPFRDPQHPDAPPLESIETTFADGGEEVFFTSGYSAREIAQKRARETDGHVYVNNVSRSIKRPDLTYPVAYAVANSPVYTLRGPDDWHEKVFRAYWPPLS